MPSSIEWLKQPDGSQGSTWNPVTGCRPDFPCWDHCYARRMANRLAGRYGYDKDVPFRPTFHPDKLHDPWKRTKPQTYFVCSMGDLLADEVPNQWIASVLDVLSDAESLQHTFILLSKRIGRWPVFLEWAAEYWGSNSSLNPTLEAHGHIPNLVIGTSVSTQAEWDARVPVLCHIPAWRRVVSVEPMLGPIDVWEHLTGHCDATVSIFRDGKICQLESPGRSALHDISKVNIHGILCGGESGPGARPMHPEWVRSLRDQCKEAGVSFYFKQWGEWIHGSQCLTAPWVKKQDFFPVGKKRAGRLLDGKEHNELAWTKETANE